jgi:hypothetical protein
MTVIDDKTPNLALPLPHPQNDGADDVLRLRGALLAIDADLKGIHTLLASSDLDMDTLQEVVNVISSAQGSIGTITSVLATKADATTVRNLIAAGLIGWSYAPSGGSAEQPAVLTYSKSNERMRCTLTWGSVGPTDAAWAYSADAGSTWSAVGTKTITYDAAGNTTGATWS